MSGTVEMLYAAPGISDTVDFTLHPAIRQAQAFYSGPDCHSWECPDEECGCPMTKWAVCAIKGKPPGQQLSWLGCWDQRRILWSSFWTLNAPAHDALACVNETDAKFNTNTYSAVKDCAEGSEGDDLLAAAADYFHTTFPMFWTGSRFSVPHVYIDDVEQDINLDGSDLWGFVTSICRGGANAPVCSVLPLASADKLRSTVASRTEVASRSEVVSRTFTTV